ncbi:MAG: hypothetical protein LBU24_05095 [Methanocalculaceae archaeon]|jgi:hypothetical protein|nr:hypothetical protein [Methanocalculaceae archaeon]
MVCGLLTRRGQILLAFIPMLERRLDETRWVLTNGSHVTLEFKNGIFHGKIPMNTYTGNWYVTCMNAISFGEVAIT